MNLPGIVVVRRRRCLAVTEVRKGIVLGTSDLAAAKRRLARRFETTRTRYELHRRYHILHGGTWLRWSRIEQPDTALYGTVVGALRRLATELSGEEEVGRTVLQVGQRWRVLRDGKPHAEYEIRVRRG